jgi:hypothetical protein
VAHVVTSRLLLLLLTSGAPVQRKATNMIGAIHWLRLCKSALDC